MTSNFGGLFIPPNNLKDEGSLDYLTEVVQSEMFGQPIYPTVHDKASVYMYTIMSNHIFNDGNKRTGLECAILFLEKNNWHLTSETSNKDLIEFATSTAEGKLDLEDVTKWIQEHSFKKVTKSNRHYHQ